MEISYQSIYSFKFKTWIDKYIRPAAATFHRPVFLRCGLYGSAAGRPYTDDTASLTFYMVDLPGLFLLYDIKLRVHVVIQDIVHLHWTKCPKTYMKGHMGDTDPYVPDLL